MNPLWLITVPVKKGETEASIMNNICQIVPANKVYSFPIPADLPFGTLENLINLSDDLNKINTQVEVSYYCSCQSLIIFLFAYIYIENDFIRNFIFSREQCRTSLVKLKDNI